MQIYPAVDIQAGRVARAAGQADPVAWAERLAAGGARWLHVVDLDRAFGSGENDALVRRVARIPEVRVQMGGLLATPEDLTRAFTLGAARAVIGTGVLAEPAVLDAILSRHRPDRLAASVDVRRGRAVLRGTSSPLTLSPADLVDRAVAAGIAAVVHRDLDRDGALGGPDLDGAARLIRPGAEIIAAGGIATRSHLLGLRDAGIAGAIVGRGLIEGTITLEEALACCS